MTNSYIASVRARFAAELKDRDTYLQICGMLLSEGAAQPLPVLESLFNRICYLESIGTHRTLVQMLHSGFYGPVNRGQLPQFINQVRHSPAIVKRMDGIIAQALRGSDVIKGFTDQGLPSDPNGWRQPQARIGGNVFNDWNGGHGYQAAAHWRVNFEAKAAMAEADDAVAVEAAPVKLGRKKKMKVKLRS